MLDNFPFITSGINLTLTKIITHNIDNITPLANNLVEFNNHLIHHTIILVKLGSQMNAANYFKDEDDFKSFPIVIFLEPCFTSDFHQKSF